MSRALGIVAEACAAVIAAEIQSSVNVTGSEARAIGRAAVAALRGDGWHITCLPLTTLPPTHPSNTAPPGEQQP
ncbi:hypothetical protein [Streptomyces griseoluteus]|uniref:hypothetical protein n=1 Tax=Streptomyces griseoluteus TaxID=29306 RepID=UPI00382A787B